MIEFPPRPAPNSCQPALLDHGGTLRSALGGASQRINRLGSRFRVALTYPPLPEPAGRIFVNRLLRAKEQGLRVEFPLAASQGVPGSPVVDGAGSVGYTLNLRGLTPNYAGKEGFWLSVVHAGKHYLHTVTAQFIAGADGKAVVSVYPALRYPFADGSAVHLAKPMIEGLIDGDEQAWEMSLAHHQHISVTIEESR